MTVKVLIYSGHFEVEQVELGLTGLVFVILKTFQLSPKRLLQFPSEEACRNHNSKCQDTKKVVVNIKHPNLKLF